MFGLGPLLRDRMRPVAVSTTTTPDLVEIGGIAFLLSFPLPRSRSVAGLSRHLRLAPVLRMALAGELLRDLCYHRRAKANEATPSKVAPHNSSDRTLRNKRRFSDQRRDGPTYQSAGSRWLYLKAQVIGW